MGARQLEQRTPHGKKEARGQGGTTPEPLGTFLFKPPQPAVEERVSAASGAKLILWQEVWSWEMSREAVGLKGLPPSRNK